jgi:hypothetical protein
MSERVRVGRGALDLEGALLPGLDPEAVADVP